MAAIREGRWTNLARFVFRWRFVLLLLFAVGQPRLGHLLADAAFLDEVLFQSAALLIQQVVGLVDKADGDVGQDIGWTGVHELAVSLVALI